MNPRGKLYLVTGANTLQLLGTLTDLQVTVSKDVVMEMYSGATIQTEPGAISGPITITLTPEGREKFEEMAARFKDDPPELKMQVQEASPPKKISYQQQQRNLPKFLRRGRR